MSRTSKSTPSLDRRTGRRGTIIAALVLAAVTLAGGQWLYSHHLSAVTPATASAAPAVEAPQLVNQLDTTECPPDKTYNDLDTALQHADNVCALTISFASLTTLPASVSSFRNIQEFRGRGTQIGALPPEIASWKKLRLLDVMDSDLAVVPPQIGQLQELRKLELGGTHIRAVAPEVGQLHNLTFFDIMDTSVFSLPAEFGNLHKLQDLDIDETGINDLTPLAKLTNLQRFIADYDENIQLAPIYGLPKLREISVAGCSLASLDGRIGQLHNLTRLNLTNNPIMVLPPELASLHSLREINLTQTKLTAEDRVALSARFTGVRLIGAAQ